MEFKELLVLIKSEMLDYVMNTSAGEPYIDHENGLVAIQDPVKNKARLYFRGYLRGLLAASVCDTDLGKVLLDYVSYYFSKHDYIDLNFANNDSTEPEETLRSN